MKTVKDVSKITGVSIRTLRYYDEIGLLNPTELTEAGYRLYDNKALEKLQEIMFFRELDIPLIDIKKIMENSNYDEDYAKSERQFRVNGAAVPFPTAHQRRPLFIDFVTLAHAYSVHSFQDGKNVFCQ